MDIIARGVLLKNDAGAWQLSMNATPQEGDTLMVLQGADPAAPGNLVSVGSISGGKAALTGPALASLPQGSIFYLVRPHN